MPLYEFRCKAGHTTERQFSVLDLPVSVRCQCGDTARRLYSVPMVPVLDEYDRTFRRRRRRNPADDVRRDHDPTIPVARGHDTKPRRVS